MAGLVAGNRKLREALTLRRFQDGMTWLAQIAMFVVFGLFATPSEFPQIALQGLALAAFLIFVARPVAVWLCLCPVRFHREGKGVFDGGHQGLPGGGAPVIQLQLPVPLPPLEVRQLAFSPL